MLIINYERFPRKQDIKYAQVDTLLTWFGLIWPRSGKPLMRTNLPLSRKCIDSAGVRIVKGFRSYFKGVLRALSALVWWVFDVEFSITDYLFWSWVVRVGRSWLIYLQRESDLLIRFSYHTQKVFATLWGRQKHSLEIGPESRYIIPHVFKWYAKVKDTSLV